MCDSNHRVWLQSAFGIPAISKITIIVWYSNHRQWDSNHRRWDSNHHLSHIKFIPMSMRSALPPAVWCGSIYVICTVTVVSHDDSGSLRMVPKTPCPPIDSNPTPPLPYAVMEGVRFVKPTMISPFSRPLSFPFHFSPLHISLHLPFSLSSPRWSFITISSPRAGVTTSAHARLCVSVCVLARVYTCVSAYGS